VQLELFTEAGAIVAERTLIAGESRDAISAILRRAANQAEALASDLSTHTQRNAVRTADDK